MSKYIVQVFDIRDRKPKKIDVLKIEADGKNEVLEKVHPMIKEKHPRVIHFVDVLKIS